MPQDLVLPDADDAEFSAAIRALRNHLLGAVDEDQLIALNGEAYVVAWADRRPADRDEPYFDLTSAMQVVDGDDRGPAIVSTGEEQITLVIDGERFVFHLVEIGDDGAHRRRLPDL